MNQVEINRGLPYADMVNSRIFRIPAALAFSVLLLAGAAVAQSHAGNQTGPYGGTVVEDIVARVNDRIITDSDYQRALSELEQEERERGASMQEMAEDRKNLLRNLIDQQLWLSKGKGLGITGDTELIKRLDDIRKQYHLASMEDLQKAAEEQGVSFEDFKANIRNSIITQDVMRQEVGEHIQITPGEARRYYEEHEQQYAQPESVQLSEVLISTEASGSDDPAKLAAAKAKAADIENRLHAGGDFAQLARRFSDGPTASEGGDLGLFHRGSLAKELEEKTFALKAGQWTEPILTRQGYIILEVTQHIPAGIAPYKDVEDQAGDALFMSRMEPAIRAYLTKMRDEAFIDIRPGYVDTGASPNETEPVFSAYVPPAPKKKRKVERTRFRETGRGFRQKSRQAAPEEASVRHERHERHKKEEVASEKPGKKEKIRYGKAPRETLPEAATSTGTVNGGALPETAVNANDLGLLPEAAPPEHKTRYSALARHKKKGKHGSKTPAANPLAPSPPTAAEVADQQTQSAPLGLGGDTAAKKKKGSTPDEKTRLADEKKKPEAPKQPLEMTPAPPVPGAPAPLPPPQQ
jgi:peptidyl-prolyl cis-trans isomerase SurA